MPTRLHVIYAGRGDAMIIEHDNEDKINPVKKIYLLDTGPLGYRHGDNKEAPYYKYYMSALKNILERVRPNEPLKLDGIVISHPHDDHFGGLEKILQGLPPTKADLGKAEYPYDFRGPLLIPIESSTKKQKQKIYRTIERCKFKASRSADGDEKTYIAEMDEFIFNEVKKQVYTDRPLLNKNYSVDTSYYNFQSILMYHKLTRMVFTGDSVGHLIAPFIKKNHTVKTPIPIFKVPHHGSLRNSQLVESAKLVSIDAAHIYGMWVVSQYMTNNKRESEFVTKYDKNPANKKHAEISIFDNTNSNSFIEQAVKILETIITMKPIFSKTHGIDFDVALNRFHEKADELAKRAQSVKFDPKGYNINSKTITADVFKPIWTEFAKKIKEIRQPKEGMRTRNEEAKLDAERGVIDPRVTLFLNNNNLSSFYLKYFAFNNIVAFYKAFNADNYVISANKTYAHPSVLTIAGIAKAAQENQRQVNILVTSGQSVDLEGVNNHLTEVKADKIGEPTMLNRYVRIYYPKCAVMDLSSDKKVLKKSLSQDFHELTITTAKEDLKWLKNKMEGKGGLSKLVKFQEALQIKIDQYFLAYDNGTFAPKAERSYFTASEQVTSNPYISSVKFTTKKLDAKLEIDAKAEDFDCEITLITAVEPNNFNLRIPSKGYIQLISHPSPSVNFVNSQQQATIVTIQSAENKFLPSSIEIEGSGLYLNLTGDYVPGRNPDPDTRKVFFSTTPQYFRKQQSSNGSNYLRYTSDADANPKSPSAYFWGEVIKDDESNSYECKLSLSIKKEPSRQDYNQYILYDAENNTAALGGEEALGSDALVGSVVFQQRRRVAASHRIRTKQPAISSARSSLPTTLSALAETKLTANTNLREYLTSIQIEHNIQEKLTLADFLIYFTGNTVTATNLITRIPWPLISAGLPDWQVILNGSFIESIPTLTGGLRIPKASIIINVPKDKADIELPILKQKLVFTGISLDFTNVGLDNMELKLSASIVIADIKFKATMILTDENSKFELVLQDKNETTDSSEKVLGTSISEFRKLVPDSLGIGSSPLSSLGLSISQPVKGSNTCVLDSIFFTAQLKSLSNFLPWGLTLPDNSEIYIRIFNPLDSTLRRAGVDLQCKFLVANKTKTIATEVRIWPLIAANDYECTLNINSKLGNLDPACTLEEILEAVHLKEHFDTLSNGLPCLKNLVNSFEFEALTISTEFPALKTASREFSLSVYVPQLTIIPGKVELNSISLSLDYAKVASAKDGTWSGSFDTNVLLDKKYLVAVSCKTPTKDYPGSLDLKNYDSKFTITAFLEIFKLPISGVPIIGELFSSIQLTDATIMLSGENYSIASANFNFNVDSIEMGGLTLPEADIKVEWDEKSTAFSIESSFNNMMLTLTFESNKNEVKNSIVEGTLTSMGDVALNLTNLIKEMGINLPLPEIEIKLDKVSLKHYLESKITIYDITVSGVTAKLVVFPSDGKNKALCNLNLGLPTTVKLPLVGDLSLPIEAVRVLLSADIKDTDITFLKKNMLQVDFTTLNLSSKDEKGVAGIKLIMALKEGFTSNKDPIVLMMGGASAKPDESTESDDSKMVRAETRGIQPFIDIKDEKALVPVIPSRKPKLKDSAETPTTANSTPPKWININKAIGPLNVRRIGVNYYDKKLWVLLDSDLMLGPITLTLDGLGGGFKLDKVEMPEFTISGLGLGYKAGNVNIAGSFLKALMPPEGLKDFYRGTATITAESFNVAAMGSYAKFIEGDRVSLFVFASMNRPFGGPPFFFVTGFSLGFGYNQRLRIPTIEEVVDFPLIQGSADPIASVSEGTDLIAVQDKLFNTSPPWLEAKAGEMWFAAGINFTTFKVIETKALAVATIEQDFQLTILGRSKMQLPKVGKPMAYVELGLEAIFNPTRGFLGMSALLSPNSYVITPDCHLTGGFAFYNWFKGEHAGDFVLTLGGYHPSYIPPPHYPKVPRLGFKWNVSSEVNLTGEAYFALTPSAVMAGGLLDANYHTGDLRAWLKAGADFLIEWHPYHYEASIGVNIGASYRLNLLFTSVTVSIQTGADLEIWGPPTGGKAHIDWTIISFTISFGEPRADKPAIGWDEFCKLLPSEENTVVDSKDDAKRKFLSIQIEDGLSQQTNDKTWIVRPDEFKFHTESTIPITAASLNKADLADDEGKQEGEIIRIKPMRTQQLSHVHKVTITSDSRTAEAPTFLSRIVKRSVPEAMWGEAKSESKSLMADVSLLTNRWVGVNFQTQAAKLSKNKSAPINIKENLGYITLKHEIIGLTQLEQPIPQTDNEKNQAVAKINNPSVHVQRTTIVTSLEKLGFFTKTNFPLNSDMSRMKGKLSHVLLEQVLVLK